MSSIEEILIKIKAQDETSGVFKKIKESGNATKMAVGAAMTAVGAATLSYAKSAVEGAVKAESEWNRFGGAVNATGGNWDAQSASVKKWVRSYSDSMGYAVADTRSAMTAMMSYGLSVNESEQAMKAVTGMAVQMGTTQEEASNKLIRAFAGQGRGLKTLGINLEDYKDKATGAIDKQKLMQDIIARTDDTVDKHANSTEAKMQRVNNALASLKTDFGKALLSAIEPLIPVVQNFLNFINGLPAPVKTAGFAMVGLAAGFTAIAGPITSAIGLIGSLGGSLSGIIGKLSSFGKASHVLTAPPTPSVVASNPELQGAWDKYITNLDKESADIDKVDGKLKDVKGKSDKLGDESKKVNSSKKKTGLLAKLGGIIPKGTGASAAEGAAEAGTASVGLSGLSASISAMIAPILALAAVIAVIIAVVAALVAEALIFARAIGELIKALGFDKLNLKPSVEGMKQIGSAIWELAKVMGAMTIASAISIISQGFAAFGVGVGTIQSSAENIKKMVPLLNQLGALPAVSPKIAQNLKSIGDGVKAIADTVSGMTSVSIGVWIGGFVDKLTGGSITNLTNAKDSLKKAIPILNEFKDIDGVDESVGSKLKAIGDGLKGASDALSALADISWTEATGWLVGLDGAMDNLSTAHDQLKDAAEKLSTFGDLPAIPAGAKERLTSVANALKSVKTSIDTLNKIDVNPLDFESKVEKIGLAREGLTEIARQLRYLGGMPQVPANVTTRLNMVKTGLIGLNSAVKATGNVGKIPDDAVSKITTNVSRLRGIAVELRYLGGMAQVPANVSTRVNMAKRGVIALNSGVLSLRNLTSVDGNAVNKVHRGVDAVKKVAKELDGLKGTGIGNARSILNTVNNALKSLNNTLRAAKGVRANSTNIGKSIVNGVKAGMASLNSSVMALVNEAMSNFRSASVSGGRTAGTEATNGFKYKFKPSTVVKDEMNYMTQAVKNGSGGFLSAMAQVASDAVQTFKTNMGQASPGHVARSMGQEMVWASEAVQNKSGILIKTVAGTARKVVDAWGNPTLNVGSNGLSKAIKSPNLNVIHDLSNNRGVNGSKKDGDVTIVNVNEGAIPVDARNMTTTEAQQLLILALEGLGIWNNKDIKGV